MNGARREARFAKSALLLTRNFPPMLGGMERLNQRMAEELVTRLPLVIIGPRGAGAYATSAAVVEEVPARPLWRFGVGMFLKVLAVARATRPWVIVGGSGLVAPFVRFAAWLSGGRSVVYLHGLDIVAPSVIYRRIRLQLLRGCSLAITNSEHTRTLAIGMGMDPSRIHVLHPGVDLPDQKGDALAASEWRRERDLDGKRVALSVGRLTRRKGLVEFIRDVLPGIVAEVPDTVLVVVGCEAVDALAGSGHDETARIRAAVADAGMQAHVRLDGPCSDAQLAAAYWAADVLAFPVQALPGDVEGFGMVALEAAAHGLPTVAYAVGGVPDAVRDGSTGWLVAPGDSAAFAAAVLAAFAPGVRESLAGSCRSFAADKAWPVFGSRLARLLNLPEA